MNDDAIYSELTEIFHEVFDDDAMLDGAKIGARLPNPAQAKMRLRALIHENYFALVGLDAAELRLELPGD